MRGVAVGGVQSGAIPGDGCARSVPAPGPPVTIETIQHTRPDLAEIAALLPQIERVAPDTVRFEAGDMAEGYAIIRVLYRNLSE